MTIAVQSIVGGLSPCDASARLVANGLQTDESQLTGESVPVGKVMGSTDAPPDAHRPGGDGQPYVYSGSLVTRGSGIACVLATGPRSEIGRIGQSLATLDTEAPRLRRETTRIVTWCAIGGVAVALLVVLLYGLLRGGWIEALLAGIAIGMSMLPDEFPVVLTVFLAMGAWRIGKVGVLTRRAAAIETLGSASVLCTDKTGTLTENRMAAAELWLPSGATAALMRDTPAPVAFHILLETAALASAINPADPMEIALQEAHKAIGDPAHSDRKMAHAYALRPDLLAMSNVWEDRDGLRISAKGAPEAIAKLCRLTPEERADMMAAVEVMGARGIRDLAVATATPPDRHWAASQTEYHYELTGVVGLADLLCSSVTAAVAECRSAGVRVVMITGDHATTARSIATQAGIADGDVLTGAGLTATRDLERWGEEVVVSMMPWQPVIDGDVIRGRSIDLIAAGAAANIDLMIGTNSEEWRLFLVPNGMAALITDAMLSGATAAYGLPAEALATYRGALPNASAGDLLAAIMDDWYFRIPAMRLADAHAETTTTSSTYVYEFAWRSLQFNGALCACHGIEIPFVFDTLGSGTDLLLGTNPPQQLADIIHAAWIAFARTGDCGWPKYDPEGRAAMRFDTRSEIVKDPWAASRAVWEQHRTSTVAALAKQSVP